MNSFCSLDPFFPETIWLHHNEPTGRLAMMSASVVSAGAAKSGYYLAEGYYAADSDEAAQASRWFGKAAAELGLEGRVDDALFSAMLEGRTFQTEGGDLYEDRRMGRMVKGEHQVRPGLDLTFSAPKSVSIAALVYQDDRLIAAHDNAVQAAMKYIETDLVQTRRSINGTVEVVTGGKVIAGLFRHDTSRALDPQLHTHAVIANMVRNPAGRYTALHNDIIYKNQKIGSQVYRNTLAAEVSTLGYQIERRGREQLLELKEIPLELIDQFSKRRIEIEDALDDRGLPDNARTAELAALATRANKTRDIDRCNLLLTWRKEAAEMGIDQHSIQLVVEKAKTRARFHVSGVQRDESKADICKEAIGKATAHLSQNLLQYEEKYILINAMHFAPSLTPEDVKEGIRLAVGRGELLKTTVPGCRERLYTDKVTLQHERDIGRLYRSNKDVVTMRASSYPKFGRNREENPRIALERRLKPSTLTEGQKEAVRTVMTGAGRIVGIQGYAGTGKTFALATALKEAERAGYTVEGLAPSSRSVEELQDAIPNAETLQARLLRGRSADPTNDPRKTILVVDEASMISNDQMRNLLTQAQEQKLARVVLVGDIQQLDGVGAGKPFALLQQLGMRTALMDDIRRQRNENARAVVNHAIAGDVRAAFRTLKDIRQTGDGGIAHGAADAYLGLSKAERETTGLVTPSNAARQAINASIRDGLKAEGALPAQDTTLTTLTPLRMSRAQIADNRSYERGDVLLVHQSVKSAGLQKGHQYEVVQAGASGVVLQDRAGGDPLPFAPAQNSKAAGVVSLYTESDRDFAIGDQIKFRIADKENRIANGDTGRITAISDEYISFVSKNGMVHQIDRNSNAASGLDHAYALTAHDFQGATVDRIIVAMGANETMADQKSFYVAVSRARDAITLVTDNTEQLSRRLEEQTGEKITALEGYIAAHIEELRDRPEREKADEKSSENDAENDPQKDRATDAVQTNDKSRDDDSEDYGRWDRIFNRERGDFER